MLPFSLVGLSRVSLTIYLMSGDRSLLTYALHVYFDDGNVKKKNSLPLYHYAVIVMSLLRQATGVWKIKMLCHPHGYSWNTRFSFLSSFFFNPTSTVSTCSEWMESNAKRNVLLTAQDRRESTPWPWVAEYVTHLKRHGTCTIIVVTTIVRFSTEDESLLYGWSIIFTKRSNSFQYPICKRENI